MSDAEEQSTGIVVVLPSRACLCGRKPEQLERVSVWVAKLERAHAATARRQVLRSADADRLPTRTRAQMRVGTIHVGYDDSEMLEPEIVAATVGRIRGRRRSRLHERERLRAKHQLRFVGTAPHAAESQCPAIKIRGYGQICDDTSQLRQANRDVPGIRCADAGGLQGGHATSPIESLRSWPCDGARETPCSRDPMSEISDVIRAVRPSDGR